ncbi:PucR family transcriptional regulator [Scatolibacter rhodanostii]|uniref:PucR family transcriptional regulator n=1 Tax=Scatolibacter rhodanostii TaxID=2014781 RepID=UPI000C076251|nr:PucR family transcriptional regulator [Scatolibacter rhodanostii]
MAVIVKKLYNSGKFLYDMKLVAGEKGVSNLVQWVHIVEDADVISFLHGNELVFTAGIMGQNSEWLLKFTQSLHQAHASAFVVNIGPHTHEVPKEVLNYCNEVNLPLFTIPWKTRMVDMTRDFCSQIMKEEQAVQTMATTLKNIIFNVGDRESQIAQMERYGYLRDDQYCFVGVRIESLESADDNQEKAIRMMGEKIAKSRHETFVSFLYQEQVVFVLTNHEPTDIEWFISEFAKAVQNKFPSLRYSIGISPSQIGIGKQNGNFEKMLSAVDTAYRRKETFLYYEDLGIYKLFYAIKDKSVLRSFYQETIGKLVQFDLENDTNLIELLQVYFKNNTNLNEVSKELYIHRNTVTNQLKKIAAITGQNPFEVDGKTMLSIGLYLKEMI